MRALALLALALAGGCGGFAGPPTQPADLSTGAPPDLGPPDVMVTIGDDRFAFAPPSVVVPHGGRVLWVNVGATRTHSITSGAGPSDHPGAVFDERILAPGDAFQQGFDGGGTQPYFCRYHVGEGERATVVVLPPPPVP